MKRKTLSTAGVLILAVAGSVGASLFLVPTNIDPANKVSWSENAGWMNWADANGGADGVFVDTEFLSGYVWMENAGWLNVGNGAGPYGNTDDTNFGVNILPNGNLRGYAWGENIGWVNFDTLAQAPDQARFDTVAGRFRGFAWGENIGWINLDDATNFVALIPDPPQPLAEPTDKTRFISFAIPGGGGETALRVNLVSLHHVVPPYTGGPSVPFLSFEGEVRWVGPPVAYQETNSNPATFFASHLQCTPHYQDWSTVGSLHVTGSAITPSSLYEVENVAASCMGAEDGCAAVSAPLEIGTTRWGDVETPYNPPSLTVQPDLADVSALVNKFRNSPGAPIKARALLVGGDAFGVIDIATEFSFIHIAGCVDAFRGRPYPHTIDACP